MTVSNEIANRWVVGSELEGMTTMQTPDTDTTDAAARRRKRWWLLGGTTVVVLAVAAFAGWWFLIRDDSPASVTSAEQEAARDQAIAEATGDGADSDGDADADAADTSGSLYGEAPPSEALPPADDEASPETDPADADPTGAGLDGTWTVDTTIGDFAEFSSSFAGFRIDEELANIGAKTVVGRTPDVTGTLEIEGTTITAVEMTVNMQTLTTDSSSRDSQIRRQAIETDTFPEATFVLTEPIEVGDIPADGEAVEAAAVGDLTVHGVTNTVEIPVTAELNSGVIVVVGQLNLLLADYGIDKPQAAVVLSVEDNADLEFQLFFTR